MSLPDVALLQPLADLLEVTVSELLSGRHIPAEEPLTAQETDRLLSGTLALTTGEREQLRASRRLWGGRFVLAAALMLLELGALWVWSGCLRDDLLPLLVVPLVMGGVFGVYFCFFARARLPEFYDQYPLNFYSDGIFRMNVPGVRFNNSTWPHILRAARRWCLAMMALYPLFYSLLHWAFSLSGSEKGMFAGLMVVSLFVLLGGLFGSIYVAARRHM